MTNNGFSFLLAALCVCVTASVGQYPECERSKNNAANYQFSQCTVTNFSAHLPVSPHSVSVSIHNVKIVDMDGCVRWLSNISRLSELEFRGADASFLDCLAKFNRSLPLNYSAVISISSTGHFPLDDWIAATFKILLGNSSYLKGISIADAPKVTRVPEAFGNQSVLSLNQLMIIDTGVSAIREHDFDGYQFVEGDFGTALDLFKNRICVVELAAFRKVNHQLSRILLFGNPIDVYGHIDWKELANRYPNATAFAKDPVCANALDTDCYRVIDTSYSGVSIMQRVCSSSATTMKVPPSERTSTVPLPTTSETSTDTPLESFVYIVVKFVKFIKVKILGGNEAEVLNKSESFFDSYSNSDE